MDQWNKTAQIFYDEYGHQKNSTAFIRAYNRILSRISFTIHNSQSTICVLDLGCGTGELAHILAKAGFQVTGIDVSEKSLVKARALTPDAQFLNADMTELPFEKFLFGGVFALTSLEFCEKKKKVLSEIKRVLKPGGLFYVEVRNRDFILNFNHGRLGGFLTKLGLLKNYPAEDFQDLSHQEWRQLFSESGFKIEREYASLRPWNYGNFLTRGKNLLIEFCKLVMPLRYQYMTAFLLHS